jgi:hypothetical protein
MIIANVLTLIAELTRDCVETRVRRINSVIMVAALYVGSARRNRSGSSGASVSIYRLRPKLPGGFPNPGSNGSTPFSKSIAEYIRNVLLEIGRNVKFRT